MGNHEFCPRCEQSDFHEGEPCLPQHLAEAERRRNNTRQWDGYPCTCPWPNRPGGIDVHVATCPLRESL